MSPVVQFLTSTGSDASGRSAVDVLAFGDDALESRHDFVQWLFPLPEPSAAVPGSPVLTADDIAALRSSPVARERLACGAARMLQFYRATEAWRSPADHNHLRITRIIRSLRLLVSDRAADEFRAEILRLLGDPPPVSARTMSYWNSV